MSRAGIATLLAAAATGLAALSMPGTASAASGITITQAGPNGGNPYVQTVVADDANGLQLTSVTVHVFSGSTEVYTIPATDMAYVSGSPDAQTWTATSAIPEADLPPGTYSVTVDATDTDETDNGLAAPATFSFSWTTDVSATASPSVLSYNETTTTISGRVTGYVPNSSYTTPVGLGGVPVYVNWVNGDSGPWDQEIGTTAADGTYSGSVQLPAADGEYTVSVNATATMDSGGTSLTTSWASDAVRLVGVSVTPKDFTYGQGGVATLTGTVQYQDSVAGWQPLGNSQVVVIAGSDVKYISTTTEGQFTWTFVPDTDGTAWSVNVGGGDLLGVAQASGNVYDAVPVYFKSFSAKLNQFAELAVHACVDVTAAGFLSPQGYMTVQYSAHPGGPWLKLGRVKYVQGAVPSSCGVNTQSYFAGTLRARLANAYYRGYFPASNSYQQAASHAVHQWKYLTRIVSVHVSPSSVGKGGKITVSGRLQQDTGRWHNFSGQRILIVLRPKGSKQWYWIRKVKTNSSGHFTATFVDPESASWTAVYEGGSKDFACSGSVHYVKVSGSAASASLLLPALSWPTVHRV
ncbi:MAG TPA: hypothetical protein VMA72_29785 [Streptosporangiaceae bacterium]|nr:hypothetical protein [Streptosporangiaceae bacterium]